MTDSFTHLLDRLEQVSAEKQAADADKQRMLADLSHDLKTPLTVIQGYAQALVDGVVPPTNSGNTSKPFAEKPWTARTDEFPV